MPDRASMTVVSGVASLTPAHGRLVAVVGVFDGMHRGHAYLLRHLRLEAARREARAAVITFDAHPDEIITGQAPPLLCDPAERLERLAAAGVAVAIVQHFDAALRMTPYDAFVGTIVERVDLAGFVMTPDAAFGNERRGTPGALAQLGMRLGFEVVVVPPFELDGQPVRSTDVRGAIGQGDFARARRLLGRAVSVTGFLEAADDRDLLMRFPMPVALPPAGRYRAVIESAAGPGGRRVVAEPRDGTLLIHGQHDLAGPGRARLRFIGTAARG
jgi:riboflavin kinase / FMN adenylyltransferase